uniref:AAA+ ATPase domain-containing protein n=1 Tax=Clastoptera arizonana TaxID=38151 RepID=A0A1B6CBN8_9HEMI
MKLLHLMLLFDSFLGIFCFIDPFSLSIGLGIAGALWMIKGNEKNNARSNVVYRKIENVVTKACQMIGYCEGCEDSWIPFNIQDLEADFKKQVFGQHIAVDEVQKTLKYHLQKKQNPDKALVLSFHGPPGVGKSMISKLVIKNMFYRGGKTNYAHFYRGSIDFPIKNEVFKYQEKLKREIIEKAEQCNRAVFVFDEVDKMPAQVLDALWQFVDKYAVYNNVDYRNIIIIFLSNLGSQNIMSKSIELWQDGKLREDYKLEDFEGIIRTAVFNASGGLQKK